VNKAVRRTPFWTSPNLGIRFPGFISLFLLDMFKMDGGFWFALCSYLIHIIPAFVLLAALNFRWRQGWVVSVLFFAGE
jgi:hypothetical protein